MSNTLNLLRQRTRRLNDQPVLAEGRSYVLCWLQQALRAEHNPIIDAAIALGNEHGLPVVVYHGLDNRYPHASHRLHRFILEASQSLGKGIVDMALPPAPNFCGKREAALSQLDHLIEHVLASYRFRRNNPADPHSTSKLSPWIHFGVISPWELTKRVKESEVHSAAKWKFLDEVLTWREYYHHLARFSDDPASYENVPAWGRRTLADHKDDERPVLYSIDQLVRGETDDETWNAAQKQFLLEGWMHNNLRMYWVKQFIKWCATPEEAWDTACLFNDRFSLDGRDPSTYGSIQWGFGRSKKAYRENPIYGWVPPKSDRALRKRKGTSEWLAEQATRPVFNYQIHLEKELS